MRSLENQIIQSLTEGELSPVLKLVKGDKELFLGIRKRNAIVYYMGGKIMDIKIPRDENRVLINIDEKYFPPDSTPGFVIKNDPIKWCENILTLKDTIKKFQRKKTSIKKEKIIQQKILLGNNRPPTKGYFIIDMEYSMPGIAYGRFDYIALHKNESSNKYNIALIELKQGNGAFGTKKTDCENNQNPYGSGIVGHAWNFNEFLNNESSIQYLQKDIVNIISDYKRLGIMGLDILPEIDNGSDNSCIDVAPDQIDIVFICANAEPIKSTRESIRKYLGTHSTKPAKYNVKDNINEKLCSRINFSFPVIPYEDDSIPNCDWFRSDKFEVLES